MVEFSYALIVLVVDVWAIAETLRSSQSTGMKIVWILAVILLPFLGLILWLLFGPRRAALAS